MNKLWNKMIKKETEGTNTENQQRRVLTDDEKHLCRYFLQYIFIPNLVAGVSKGELSPDTIFQTDDWENFMKKHVDENFFLEWDELHCDGIKIDDTHVIALYIFPKPRQVPEAAFGAVLIDTATNNATYYTLEYSYNGEWVLGSMNQSGHLNYGNLDNPGLERFIGWVIERAKGAPVMNVNLFKEDSDI